MIKIICVGKLKEKYLIDLVGDYKSRISKYHKIDIIELKDSNISKESENIVKLLKRNEYNILLGINGKTYNTLEFKDNIEKVFNSYGNITFIIGGSNGVNDSVREFCNEELSFSRLTFPHGLFRGILLEQIYRAFKIINNEEYHK